LDNESYFEERPLSTRSATQQGNEASRENTGENSGENVRQNSGERSQLRRRTGPRPRGVARISSQRRASWQSGDCGPNEVAKANHFAADLYPYQARLSYTGSAVREISTGARG